MRPSQTGRRPQTVTQRRTTARRILGLLLGGLFTVALSWRAEASYKYRRLDCALSARSSGSGLELGGQPASPDLLLALESGRLGVVRGDLFRRIPTTGCTGWLSGFDPDLVAVHAQDRARFETFGWDAESRTYQPIETYETSAQWEYAEVLWLPEGDLVFRQDKSQWMRVTPGSGLAPVPVETPLDHRFPSIQRRWVGPDGSIMLALPCRTAAGVAAYCIERVALSGPPELDAPVALERVPSAAVTSIAGGGSPRLLYRVGRAKERPLVLFEARSGVSWRLPSEAEGASGFVELIYAELAMDGNHVCWTEQTLWDESANPRRQKRIRCALVDEMKRQSEMRESAPPSLPDPVSRRYRADAWGVISSTP